MRPLLLTLLAVLLSVLPATAAVDDELPVDIDIVDLTSIEWGPGEPLPRWIQNLDGRRVRIAGYMHASTQDDASEFMLVDDSCICIGNPQPHHFLDVTLVDQTTSRRQGLVDVVGTFDVGELEDENGYVKSLFRLTADVIE